MLVQPLVQNVGPSVNAGARTLAVAQSWTVGLPFVYFTTITLAQAQASTMTPTPANPVVVTIHSGTYTENVTLVSNVHMIGAAQAAVLIAGNITWTPGAGVNVGQIGQAEQINLNGIAHSSGSFSLTYDSSAKTAGTSSLMFCSNTTFGFVTVTGRGSTNTGDNYYMFNGILLSNGSTFTNMQGSSQSIGVEFIGTRVRGSTFAGNTVARLIGGEHLAGACALTGTANVTCTSLTMRAWTVASGCTLTAPGCNLTAAQTISVASGGTADLRNVTLGVAANIVGPGTINRTVWNGTTGTTVSGANTITFTIPYPDAVYNVTWSLVSGPGNAAMTYGTKLGASFVLTDSVGGNVWDYTVHHI